MRITVLYKVGMIICLGIFYSVQIFAQAGCTDPLANNFNNSATQNDGSCTYNATIAFPTNSNQIDIALSETSGLISWRGNLWTHNDSSDTNLYEIDPFNGGILSSISLDPQVNVDWEEIAQDADFIYVGNFGNNVNGNRTDLSILKISKTSILAGTPQTQVINFAYEDQIDFSPRGSNNTNYDCEAFIISNNNIFLFTKEWNSGKTRVYKLPKTPGNFQAELQETYNIDGLVTGAVFKKEEGIIALSGYSNILQPFVFLLYDFTEEDFFSGNKRKININLPFHQVEGITTDDGFNYFITNERFNTTGTVQKLHKLDLTQYLEQYLNIPSFNKVDEFLIYPNPASSYIKIGNIQNSYPFKYTLLDTTTRVIMTGDVENKNSRVDISELSAGTYFIKIGANSSKSYKLIKR